MSMAEDDDNLVLRLIREIRAEVGATSARLACLERKMDEVSAVMAAIVREVAKAQEAVMLRWRETGLEPRK